MRVHVSADLEVVSGLRCEVGEGPVWDAGAGQLLWVDIPAGLVHRLDPSSGRPMAPVDVGQPVGAVAPRSCGGLVAAVRDGFGFIDVEHDGLELAAAVEPDVAGNRMNDGTCDRAGRFWAGTMDQDMTPGAGALYRFDLDKDVTKVLDGLAVPNGIGWDPDDTTMYFIDSGSGGVDAFDYDAPTGAVRNRRRVVDVPTSDGLPDGMATDAEGCLWVAIWGGSQVRRFTPDGRLDSVVELPVAQVTSCTFGGPDLDELFITTGSSGLDEQGWREQPLAGALFRVVPGPTGAESEWYGG